GVFARHSIGAAPARDQEGMMTAPRTDAPGRKELRWGGRLILGLIFATGVAFSIYAGLVFGMILGLQEGVAGAPPPGKGTGLAPDLSGTVKMFVDTGAGGAAGAIIGLLVGLLIMWAVCRLALAPLLRRIPGL